MHDVEGDGNLGYEEIYNGLVRANVDVPADLEDIFQEMDSDGSGSIEYTEFLSATLLKELMTEDNVWTAFRTFDQDGDGAIAVTEMYNILNKRTEEGSEGVSKQEVLDLMSEITSSDDLSLNFPDFWNMMRKGWGDAEDKMRSKRVTRKEEDNISD
jgi:calcium-dependent protein kinase